MYTMYLYNIYIYNIIYMIYIIYNNICKIYIYHMYIYIYIYIASISAMYKSAQD